MLLTTKQHKQMILKPSSHLSSMLRRPFVLALVLSLPIVLFFFIVTFHVKYLAIDPTYKANVVLQNEAKQYGGHYQFSVLIGILTLPDRYDRRHFLRLVYGVQSSLIAEIQVKFVFCNFLKPEQRVFIALETLRFKDIIILNCTENMNSGKTYTYFSSLPSILSRKYDYVMKADDDVFIRLDQLAVSLRPLPRVDLYYGFVLPCTSMNAHIQYMSGMGYLLSWDIVEWIKGSQIPKEHLFGPEDKMVGKWLEIGKKGANRFTSKPSMYDYPGTNGKCSHELIPETIAVHRLKRWDQWLKVLQYFNVTKSIGQSN